jgi:anti-sigma factor RsiW
LSFPIIPGGISCREVVEIVTDYLDGALTAEDRARMDAHLEACPPCLLYVEQIRTTRRLAAEAEAEREQRPDREALLAAFRDFRRGPPP